MGIRLSISVLIDIGSLGGSFSKAWTQATLLDGEALETEMDCLNKSQGKVRGYGNIFFSFESMFTMKHFFLGICCKAEVIFLTCLYFSLTFIVIMILALNERFLQQS